MKLRHLTEREAHVIMLDACGLLPKEVCKHLGITRSAYEGTMTRAENKLSAFRVTLKRRPESDKRGTRIIKMERRKELKETGFEAAKRLAAEAGLIQT